MNFRTKLIIYQTPKEITHSIFKEPYFGVWEYPIFYKKGKLLLAKGILEKTIELINSIVLDNSAHGELIKQWVKKSSFKKMDTGLGLKFFCRRIKEWNN